MCFLLLWLLHSYLLLAICHSRCLFLFLLNSLLTIMRQASCHHQSMEKGTTEQGRVDDEEQLQSYYNKWLTKSQQNHKVCSLNKSTLHACLSNRKQQHNGQQDGRGRRKERRRGSTRKRNYIKTERNELNPNPYPNPNLNPNPESESVCESKVNLQANKGAVTFTASGRC